MKGIGPRYAGSLIGMLNSIEQYDTVSALWSYCGMDVIPVCEKCGRICLTGKEKARFLNRQANRRWEMHQLKEKKTSVDIEDFKRTAYLETEKKLCICELSMCHDVAPDRKYFKGLLLTYNPFLKMTCWKIAGQFVRQGDFYRTRYEQKKEYYQQRDGNLLSKIHIENRARRATVKLFLSHLWVMWRKSESLPIGETYLQSLLGSEYSERHQHISPPYATLYDEMFSLTV